MSLLTDKTEKETTNTLKLKGRKEKAKLSTINEKLISL